MEEMKKCPHCGAIQKPERQTCIDCGRVLPEAHPEFAHELDKMADEKLTGRLDYDDPRSLLYRFRLVLAILGGVLAIAGAVCIYLLGKEYQVVLFAVPVLCGIMTVLWSMFPKQMSWTFSRRRYYGVPEYIDDTEKLFIFVFCVILLAVGIIMFAGLLADLEPIHSQNIYNDAEIIIFSN